MYLNFRAEAARESTSWQRADDDRALIERTSTNRYLVTLPDGETHRCHIGKERGGWVGRCDCKGFEFGDDGSPCAHLCTLRKAAFVDAVDVRGQPVEAHDTLTELEHGREQPGEAVADGGRQLMDNWAAGTLEQPFGRPEGRL